MLTLHTFSLTGGVEKVCKILAKVLDDAIASKVFNKENIQLLSLCDRSNDIDLSYFKKEHFKGFGYNRFKFGLVAILSGLKCDTIILSHINLLPIAYCIKLLAKQKMIIMLAHGTEVWRNIRPWKKHLLQKHIEIWAVSEFTSKMLQEKHQISKHQIKVLNNCLDPYLTLPKVFNKPNHLVKRYKLHQNQPVVLTISRLSSLEAYKGYDLVIKTMPMLLKKFPNLVYILSGQADLKEKTKINSLIKANQLTNNVFLTGYIPADELVNYFLLADVFVMPSKKEGFGIVFIEATACGCPVIAGNQDGSTDALLNGNLGFLINPESSEELIDAIAHTLTRGKSHDLSIALQRKCVAHFNYESYREKVLELLSPTLTLPRSRDAYPKGKGTQDV